MLVRPSLDPSDFHHATKKRQFSKKQPSSVQSVDGGAHDGFPLRHLLWAHECAVLSIKGPQHKTRLCNLQGREVDRVVALDASEALIGVIVERTTAAHQNMNTIQEEVQTKRCFASECLAVPLTGS